MFLVLLRVTNTLLSYLPGPQKALKLVVPASGTAEQTEQHLHYDRAAINPSTPTAVKKLSGVLPHHVAKRRRLTSGTRSTTPAFCP